MSQQSIVLGGGCFWCTEAIFQRIKGVVKIESGYANGLTDTPPSYEEVCTGETGYAEVVRIEFDTEIISLEQILLIFFMTHDPTTLNRQGNDVGTQYRSAVYIQNEQEEQTAKRVIQQLQQAPEWTAGPIVTEVAPLRHYWPAEDYHQNYFANHPGQGYCAFVIAPKIQKMQTTLREFLR